MEAFRQPLATTRVAGVGSNVGLLPHGGAFIAPLPTTALYRKQARSTAAPVSASAPCACRGSGPASTSLAVAVAAVAAGAAAGLQRGRGRAAEARRRNHLASKRYSGTAVRQGGELQPRNPNVQFYRDELQTSVGTISEVQNLSQDYAELEIGHTYIQWLFPNYFPSRFNPDSFALSPGEAREFREDPEIARRYLYSYCLFLDFLGLKLLDPWTGEVGRAFDGEARLHTALVKRPHNQLRVQRVLASLAVTGFRRYVAPLAAHLEWEVTGRCERVVSDTPVSTWRRLQSPALKELDYPGSTLDRWVVYADGNEAHFQQCTRALESDSQDSVFFGSQPAAKVAPEPEPVAAVAAPQFEPSTQVGACEPLGFFDPLALCDGLDEVSFREMQLKEVNNGRLAMVAFTLAVVQECYTKQPAVTQSLSLGATPNQGLAFTAKSSSGGKFGRIWRRSNWKTTRHAAALGNDCPPGNSEVPRRRDLIQRFSLPEDCLAPAFDWSYVDSGPGPYTRGGKPYHPPYGFDKLGLSTVKFDDNSFMDRQNGWHVAYHGTDPQDVPEIIREGLKAMGGRLEPKHGNMFGHGIYCSPQMQHARNFAGEVRVGAQSTPVILMARVRPGAYSEHSNGDVWLVKNPQDIRCHSILFARDAENTVGA